MKKSYKVVFTLVILVVVCFFVISKIYTKNSIKHTDSEVVIQGIVVDNNLETPEIGAFLHIKEQSSDDDIFVVYDPYNGDGKELPCLNPVDGVKIRPNMMVEVKGVYLDTVNGQKPAYPMISTCKSTEFYIRVIK